MVSYWTQFTLEQERIERRMGQLGVAIQTRTAIAAIVPGGATLASTISGETRELACDAVVLATDRLPRGSLAADLAPSVTTGQLHTLRVIGDADAPSIIAQAVFAGHLAAREFDAPPAEGPPFRVER